MAGTRELKEGFDVRAWLDEVGVSYSTSGDNVTQGWVGMPCIYCRDHANHMGVNLKRGNFYCWLCGEKGDALRLVMDVEGVPFPVARERLSQFSKSVDPVPGPVPHTPRAYGSLLPRGSSPITDPPPAAVANYLERRRFPPGIVGEYGLMWCGPGGELPLRIVVPVRVGGDLVTWQAADVTGRAAAKYVSCPKDRGLANIKDVVYGIDDVSDSPVVAVVEGVTDRWRVGRRRCVALFGKEASEAQLLMLRRGIRRDATLVAMLDADAHEHVRRLSRDLAKYHRTRAVLLQGGDPEVMSSEWMEEVLR